MEASALRAGVAQAPLRGMRVCGVPATKVAVDPLRIRLETGAQLLIERVLLRGLRVGDVRLTAGEMDDQGGAAVFAVLPHDLRADVTNGALALPVVPFLSQCEEFAETVLSKLQACDRAVHLTPFLTAGCCRAFVSDWCPACQRESVAPRSAAAASRAARSRRRGSRAPPRRTDSRSAPRSWRPAPSGAPRDPWHARSPPGTRCSPRPRG